MNKRNKRSPIQKKRIRDIISPEINASNSTCLFKCLISYIYAYSFIHVLYIFIHFFNSPYLNLLEQLMTGKNMPSKLKFVKDPVTLMPLNIKFIIGTVKSSAQPITSPGNKGRHLREKWE